MSDKKRVVKKSCWPKPTVKQPTISQMEQWSYNGYCLATDGCKVEEDGICAHGHPSWMLRFGII